MLGRAGSLHLPPVVLTPWMKGNLEDSVYKICINFILWVRGLCQFEKDLKEESKLRDCLDTSCVNFRMVWMRGLSV